MSVNLGDDKVFLQRFLVGDEQAFTETYDRYWYGLYLSCYRKTKNKAVAEEIVQNLFLKLWEKRGTLEINQLENYLFSSVRNATIDYLNKQMVADKYLEYQKVFQSLQANTTEEMVGLNNLQEEIEKGLQALSGKSERIFRLHRMDNWPVEKIARHLNLTEKSVHYHLTRSGKFIRSYLQELTLCVIFFF